MSVPNASLPTKRARTGVRLADFPFELRVRPVERSTGLGLLEISHAEGATPPTVPMRFVFALDVSGSMHGPRIANLKAGLRAMLQLLRVHVPDAEVAILAFNDEVHPVFGPAASLGDEDEWARIEAHLQAGGFTDIERALNAALDLEAPAGTATTLLLLTDGEDHVLARGLQRNPDHALAKRLAGLASGVSLHMVGICAEADAVLLNTLAEYGRGTFVCIRDADIKGLMGSLLGLVLEQLPHTARIFIGERLVRSVFLRVGVPTRVPFALDDDNAAAQLCVRMDLLALGEDRVEHAVRLETQPEDGTDWEVRLAHAREWTGETAAAVARALANDALDVASAALDAVLERVRRLLLPDASPPSAAFVELVASLEAERAELAAAAHDRAQLRELSARSASHASTVRNSGRSLGADGESATQASMRTQSMAY
jgi:hypothetical protein